MRILEAYNNILIELNKVLAPSLLLDDFIYLFNKGVQEYINERYNLFETKQLLTDDLRVLLKSTTIPITTTTPKMGSIYGYSYKLQLPYDYVHLLNCVCEFKHTSDKCSGKSYTFSQGANKINSNLWPHVINNYYLRPSTRNPYYYIMNVDDPSDVGASYTAGSVTLTGRSNKEDKQANAGNNVRYGNTVQPVINIVCGDVDPKNTLTKVFIDYLRAPLYYSLSQNELDSVVDNSQVIEFPDYVTYEIINRIVKLILENNANPRVQTHPAVNQTIV